jgi:hypothetical protein
MRPRDDLLLWDEFLCQVPPLGIVTFDQLDLLGAAPFLELLLAGNRSLWIIENLEID